MLCFGRRDAHCLSYTNMSYYINVYPTYIIICVARSRISFNARFDPTQLFWVFEHKGDGGAATLGVGCTCVCKFMPSDFAQTRLLGAFRDIAVSADYRGLCHNTIGIKEGLDFHASNFIGRYFI